MQEGAYGGNTSIKKAVRSGLEKQKSLQTKEKSPKTSGKIMDNKKKTITTMDKRGTEGVSDSFNQILSS